METGDLIALAISAFALFVSVNGGKRANDHDVADHAHWQGRMEEKLDGIDKNTVHTRDEISALSTKVDSMANRLVTVEHKVDAHEKQIDGIWDQMRNDAAQGLMPTPKDGEKE